MARTAASTAPPPAKSPYKPETAAEFLAHHKAFMETNLAPAWIQTLRAAGAKALAEFGLPTPNLERWKYTNMVPAVRGLGTAMSRADVAFEDPAKIVTILGEAYKNTPAWLQELQSRAPAGEDRYHDRALWHMCNAFLRDGIMVDVPAGKIVEKPLEITITGHDGGFFVPRTAFRIGKGAELTVIEHHRGDGKFWNNRLTQIIVEEGAHLRHYRIQDYSDEAVYTQNTHVELRRDATYEAFTLTKGCALSRNQIHADLTGRNAACNLYGINLLHGTKTGDTTITIEHQAPHCTSRQFYRSVLDDQAQGVFQGKVHVHKEAQKTDGYQLSNALILSEGASMETKPELEIYADDVKCSHGATTGQLDEQALFYMRSRGIDEAAARTLLITAFLQEVTDHLHDKTLDQEIVEIVTGWLRR